MPELNQEANPPALFYALDAFVADDPAPPGIRGIISIVVRDGNGDNYWYGAFTDTEAKTGIIDFVPENADAILILTRTQANEAIAGDRSAENASVVGDLALLNRFVERYVSHRGWLAVRSGG